MKKIWIITLILVALASVLSADLAYGKYQFNEALYDEAIIEFEKIIRTAPTSEAAQEAWHYIGRSYLEKEQLDRAEEAFRKVIEGYPNSRAQDQNLFYLAQVQKTNGKYSEAIKNYKQLFADFPLSDFTQRALTDYVESYFLQEEYQMVIVQGERLADSYPQNQLLAEVYYLMAKAYFAENMPEQGEAKLAEVIENYATSNAKWQAVQTKVERLEASSGTAAAARELQKLLQADVPRLFEEDLRLQLSAYYFELQDYAAASEQLQQLKSKFNNSDRLDEIITKLSFAKLQQKLFSEITANYETNRKVFRQSSRRASYELLVAEAWLEQQEYQQAEKFLAEILKYAEQAEDLYQAGFLQAVLLEKSGKLQAAAAAYKKLLDSAWAERDLILMRLGDIYLEYFDNYSLARKYYQQIFLNSDDLAQVQKAIYKSALCSETLGDFSAAVKELEQIDPQQVEEQFLREKIVHKLSYLKKYREQDYQSAFQNLLNALNTYLESDNQTELKGELAKILAEDLKEQKQSLQLLAAADTEILQYRKAKVLIDLAERNRLEMKSAEAAEYLQQANAIIQTIAKPAWKAELEIWLAIAQEQELKAEIIQKISQYTQQNSSSSAANQFRLLAAEYFWEINADLAADWADALQNESNISQQDFALNKLKLAEYYFGYDNKRKALENYQLAQSEISLQYPQAYYHYAVVLNESGQPETAAEKLAFLVNNRESFPDFPQVVKYFAEILRELERYEQAVRYQLQIPAEARDSEFYQQVSSDYLAIGNQEKAKEMLMYIPEKSEQILAELARLQFVTEDYQFAEYSYNKLLEMNAQELDYYWYLGQIKFAQAEYLAAAENFKIIVDRLGDNLEDFANIRQLARQNVIALYRINNRPKAEKLQKQFKDVLTEADENEIMLSRGIYYVENDKKEAKKIFSKMIKQSDLEKDILIAAYFWRGVVNLQQKETAEAEADFKTVANSTNLDYSNQAHLKLGTLNFTAEKYPQALQHYYQVIENDDDGKLAFDAAQNFALVCKTIEEWQKAIAAYEIILERWGDEGLEAETVFDIAFCHYRDKRYPHAVEMFEQALAILDDEELKAEAQYWIGEGYFGMEEYEKAISELLKVGYNYASYTDWAASAELRAGEAYLQMNNPMRARQIYQRVISKYGAGSRWGNMAQQRLAEMK
ncbi:MAG: tetratricopeptide repeat protein [Candidatus Cloacimonadales bacterium]